MQSSLESPVRKHRLRWWARRGIAVSAATQAISDIRLISARGGWAKAPSKAANRCRRRAHPDWSPRMVLAQGLGDADRQAPRTEKGDRGLGAPAGGDHVSHLG